MNPRLLLPVLLLAAACSADPEPATTTPSAPPSAATAPTVALTGTGFSLALPQGWTPVDPSTDTSPAVAGSFGLDGDNPDLIRGLMEEEKKQGVRWAIDPATVEGSLATHASAGCESGGLTGSGLEDLRRKATLLNKNAKVTDTTIGGKPALRITYTDTDRAGRTTDTINIRVPVSAERYCYLELAAKPGGLATVADQIIASFTLT